MAPNAGANPAMFLIVALALLSAAIIAYILGAGKARRVAGASISTLHSRPAYHGGYVAILTAAPALLAALLWIPLSNWFVRQSTLANFSDQVSAMNVPELEAFLRDVQAIAFGGIVGFRDDLRERAAEIMTAQQNLMNIALIAICIALVVAGFLYGMSQIRREKRTRHFVERFVMILLIACSAVAILTTIGIVFSLIFETIRFFGKVAFFDFLFGLNWSPQSAFTSANAQLDPSEYGAIFGAVPLFAGTLLITAIAILVAAPIGLMSAIYLSDYASAVSYTHLRAHETKANLVCRLLLEKKKH